MVVFDTETLLYILDPTLRPPSDPNTDQPVTYVKERIDALVDELQSSREKIIIPTPVIAELVVLAGAAGGSEYLRRIDGSACFQVEAFDQRSAIELALMTYEAIKSGDKKAGSNAVMAKVKFDRQIVAIAKVHAAACIYTCDRNLTKFARDNGLNVTAVWELPLPESLAQTDLWSQSNAGQQDEGTTP